MAAKKASATKTFGDLVASINELFMELFTPAIVKAKETAVIGTRNPADVGNQVPVPMNLVYLLRGIVQQIKTTLKSDPRTSRNGNTIYCLKDTKDYYQSQFCKLEARYQDRIEDLVIDPQYTRVTTRMESAFAAYDLFTHLESLFEGLYAEVAGEPWTPWEQTAPKGAVGDAMVAAQVKERLAKHAEIKARVAS